MADPFHAFDITMNLRDGYVAWDKSARIDCPKPARGTIRAVFEVPRERLKAMRAELVLHGSNVHDFEADLADENGQVAARVRKTVQVRTQRAGGRQIAANIAERAG